MNNIKSWLLGMVVTIGSIITLPAHAWPEVDHMNMCGAATKAVHGDWNGWAQHDKYIARRGNAYYLRTNCPKTVAPSKKKVSYKKVAYKKPVAKKVATKSTTIKSVKRSSKRSGYKSHAAEVLDCARVDRMNGVGSAVYEKRKYNYFKKR